MNNRINKLLLVILLVLALGVTSSCKGKALVTKIETGPTQTIDIQVPMPEAGAAGATLNLEFAAGELKLSPGDNNYLASGTATVNAADLAPVVTADGNGYKLSTGEMQIEGFPKLEDELQNTWDLRLARTPLNLSIDAVAYTGDFELGGLALESLTIEEGGSDLTGRFSAPNQVEMSTFSLNTGGASMNLYGLANANFAEMNLTCGAGDYTLSFDGDLQRDASVMIDTGASTVNLIVPPGVNAQVTFEGGLSSVVVEGGWAKNGEIYTLSGSGPSLTITVKMGLGTLNLKNG